MILIANTKFRLKWEWETIKARFVAWRLARKRGFSLPTVRHDEPIPPDSNPFHYDQFNMGSDLVRGWMVMHPGYDRKEDPQALGYLILVNTRTGQRIRITGLS